MRKLTVIVPGLRWPDEGDFEYLFSQVKTPWLNRLLGFASVRDCHFSYSDYYYSLLFDENPDAKITSLACAYAKKLGVAAKWNSFLLASPTHLRIDRNRILISESELLQLDFSESQQLIELLNRHFTGECEFFYITDELWLLGVAIDTSEMSSVPLFDIIGENINEFLPHGKGSLAVNALANEIQMLFYDCPINKLRNQEDLLAVNGVWLWDRRDFSKILSSGKVISSNLTVGNPINNIGIQLVENDIVLIDQLYYPSRYRDAYAWINTLNLLDCNLFCPLFELWLTGSVNQISVIIPQLPECGGGLEFRLAKRGFWQRFLKAGRSNNLNYIFNL